MFDDKSKQIANTYYCTTCNKAIYNANSDSNTNMFLRHKCMVQSTDKKMKMMIQNDTKEEFKTAAAKFIAKDLRPYSAIEGHGLFDLCTACMKFGQRYKHATSDDLRGAIPCRNTVKAAIQKSTDEIKIDIRKILSEAKLVGGIAITSDTWTDKFKNLTYICLVAHCNTIGQKGIESHRFILYTNQITELVKNKEVIVKYILSVLSDYGFEIDEVKEFITFVTDRGGNFKYGLTSSGFQRHNCYAHLIHNLV